MSRDPIVVRGALGWGNPGTERSACALACYGPGGRWADDRPGTKQAGDLLADALSDAGLTEGATLIVVAVPRFGDVEDVASRISSILGID